MEEPIHCNKRKKNMKKYTKTKSTASQWTFPFRNDKFVWEWPQQKQRTITKTRNIKSERQYRWPSHCTLKVCEC